MKIGGRWNWPRIVSSPAELSVFTFGGSVVILYVPNPSFLGMVSMIFCQSDHFSIYKLRHLPSDKTIYVCGNKMPTRCKRGFYCRSYCLLNMFRAPLCPSSGAQEYYTVVAACGISCFCFQVAGLVCC